MSLSPFDDRPDPELGSRLREALTGPAPEAFLARLRAAVAGAEREDQWEVLDRWSRPGVFAAAAAAALLLWLGARGVLGPAHDPAGTGAILPAYTVAAPQGEAREQFYLAVMEGR